jgi:segregation and condensation protein A
MADAMTVEFDVDLPSYHGPLDLLLYLIRRQELPLENLSLARITRQYTDFLSILQELDLDNISEYIEIVSVLIEMKSDRILPRSTDENEDPHSSQEVPSSHLVERLIQYKRFRDIACVLDEQSRLWQLHMRRLAPPPARRRTGTDPEESPMARIEVWDLVSAFGRILKARQASPAEAIRYDETPIQLYMSTIHERLRDQERLELHELFEPGLHKSALVGIFLATLEMIRYHGLQAEQKASEGSLWLYKGEKYPDQLELGEAVDRNDIAAEPR